METSSCAGGIEKNIENGKEGSEWLQSKSGPELFTAIMERARTSTEDPHQTTERNIVCAATRESW